VTGPRPTGAPPSGVSSADGHGLATAPTLLDGSTTTRRLRVAARPPGTAEPTADSLTLGEVAALSAPLADTLGVPSVEGGVVVTVLVAVGVEDVGVGVEVVGVEVGELLVGGGEVEMIEVAGAVELPGAGEPLT
jgi:hypothetical protein